MVQESKGNNLLKNTTSKYYHCISTMISNKVFLFINTLIISLKATVRETVKTYSVSVKVFRMHDIKLHRKTGPILVSFHDIFAELVLNT